MTKKDQNYLAGEYVHLLKRVEAANLRADNMERERDQLRVAVRGAIAALSQNKTFPADVEAAKSFLADALTGGDK